MIETTGDLWEAHDLGHWVAITTNGIVNAKGQCVMGRGVARQAAQRFTWLPTHLGDRIRTRAITSTPSQRSACSPSR